jgi:CRP-like cAMP-binding protein
MARRTLPEQADAQNRLLAALPAGELSRLRPSLTTTTLEFRRRLEVPGKPPTHVYFPWSGVCSLTAAMEDGRIIEVATIGNEGVVGMFAYFGSQLPDALTVVQVPGAGADAMRVRTFVAEMDRRGPLYHLVRRYSQALLALIMQTAACNALHDVEQRCARWLLMTHDRIRHDRFRLTQEYLAAMLAVRRPSVTVVARKLQHEGMIAYRRGEILILNRRQLESQSCECYRVVQAHFERLLP